MEIIDFFMITDTWEYIKEYNNFKKLNDYWDVSIEIFETVEKLYNLLEDWSYCEFKVLLMPLIVNSMIVGRKRTQLELMEEIREKSNINIVTCGNCGGIILEEMFEKELIHCHCCGYNGEPCDMPDLFYEGQKEEI